MNHYKNNLGYAWLFLILYLICLVGALITMGLLGGYFKVENPAVMGTIVMIPPALSTYLAAGRFITIERRKSTGSEMLSIALLGFLMVIAVPVVILIIGALVNLGNPETLAKLVPGLGGAIAFLGITSYVALLLNFGPIAWLRYNNREKIARDHSAAG